MRTIKITILIVLFTVLIFSPPIREVVSQPQLPDNDRITKYVNNLIDCYNALVNANYKHRPYFNDIKSYFSLYHELGNSFKVIVVKGGVSPDDIALLFIPIPSDKPEVIINLNCTLDDLARVRIGGHSIIRVLEIELADKILYISPVLSISLNDILGDYLINSKNDAEYFYKQDEEHIPQPSQNENYYYQVLKSFFYYILGAIIFVFGSLYEAKQILGNKAKREKFKRRTKQLWVKCTRKIKRGQQRVENREGTPEKR